MGCDMWFGTKEYSRWVPTPQTGADVSASAWSDDGGFLNGAGYALNSRGSHKRYVFSWGSSNARETAQLFKSYFDGSFGRGKLYLIDPLTTSTNVLPARWADPSIGLDYEAPPLVPGVLPTRSSASGFERLQLPVASASYNLAGSPAQTVTKETVVENLFTNPRLKGDGTYAEVARNLFTNPRLVGDGTWAEVRRNFTANPLIVGTAGFTPNRCAVTAPGGGVLEATVTEVGYFPRYSATATHFAAAAGSVVTVSADIEAGSAPVRARLAFFSDAAATVQIGSAFESVGTASGRMKQQATAPAGAIRCRAEIGIADNAPLGTVFRISKPLVEVNSTNPYSWFDPTAPSGSVEPDMRQRWLGTPNASESVMEIERVRGLTAVNCVAGVSTKDGKPAMRLIATGSSTDSFASLVVPEVARARGTLLGHIHTLQDAVPPLSSNRRSLRVIEPNFVTLAPLEAGSYPLRLAFGPTSVGHQARWYHGGTQGSGDVWWTDIGLFAGDYKGEYFHGSYSPGDSTLAQPEDFRWRWVGAVDNSESVMEIERVRGLSGSGCVAGVSSRAGKPAARLIPTGTSTYTYASIAVPTSARNHGTAIGTSHLDAPLVGPGLNGKLATLRARDPDPSVPVPNAAGSYPQRVVFGPLTSLHRIELMHGGALGSGDVWWTDIGIYAGDYDGPNFTGSDGTVQYNGETLRTEWVGAEDNSVSRAVRFRTTGTPRITENNSLFVPIPDGHQLNLGAFYSASGNGGVWAVSATAGGGIGDIITPLTQLDGTSSSLFPDVITKPPGIIGAYIWIGSVGSSSGSSVTINAMHARISPVGEPPKGENMWIGGQGNEGVRFAGPPTYINVNGRDGGRIEFAATFVESVL